MAGKPTFKIETGNADGRSVVKLSGAIDEFALLPEIKSEGQITLDLSGVTIMNSEGTRLWCIWIQRFQPPADVSLVGCPFHFVKAFNAIRGFLTAVCHVDSFMVPFYSEVTNENVDFLALRGAHYKDNGEFDFAEVKDSKGNLMELDVVPETYFAFLKH